MFIFFIFFIFLLALLSFGSTYWNLLFGYSDGNLLSKFFTIRSIFVSGITDWQITLIALLQGITIGTIITTILKQRKIDYETATGSIFTTILVSLGLGCPACGTSLLIPFLSIFLTSGISMFAQFLNYFLLLITIGIDILILLKTWRTFYQISLVAEIPKQD